MESSLHRELKRLYAGEAARTEVRLGRYIIDAIICDEHGCDILIEVQHGPLTAGVLRPAYEEVIAAEA